jgi:hypothetical protein
MTIGTDKNMGQVPGRGAINTAFTEAPGQSMSKWSSFENLSSAARRHRSIQVNRNSHFVQVSLSVFEHRFTVSEDQSVANWLLELCRSEMFVGSLSTRCCDPKVNRTA